ncbi:hypothetical protein Ctob_009703 [Chrysochromulina tobinii]|uniref:Uncharacterized protein n=1 Tax=Chrysochromulina tobinii TaxID=1460289 RepID=A0A0M0LQ64_9EUKA|nr:hypothetical protein Ctob_009703 [Chrysochromulina tobinii]|eukprot:KOO53210.1 hypothetical protein Ctob_009703 [Chrysochromulina sp. CCMP291]
MDEAKLPDALQALESFEELEECALVLAEPPDESEAHRERAAAAAFTVQAVQAVCCYPGPLLAVYNAQFDTGVLVDVGFPATFIYIMYDGKSVLDGAVLHGLGGKHCGRTADASCDGLFDPSLLDDEHAAAKELCGLPEAIVRTVMLADRRMDKASDWHSTGQLGDACAVWYRYADARRAAVGTMHKVCARFGCRRALGAFFRQARRRKLARLFKARSEWAALKTTLERALRQWSYMASMIHQAAHVRAKQKKSEREDGLLRWARATQAKAKAEADLAEAAGFARTGIAIQFWVAATRAAVDGRKRRRLEAITSRSRMLKIRRRFEFRHFVRAHLARKALKTHLAEVRRQMAMLKLRFDSIKAEVHPPSAAITLIAT